MRTIPLTLSVKTKAWRQQGKLPDLHASEGFEKAKRAYLDANEADPLVCAGCGLVTRIENGNSGFFDFHHVDDDHTNNDLSNLVPVCPFCHSVFHFGLAFIQKRGFFVTARGVTQRSLNRMTILSWHMPFANHPLMKDIAGEIFVKSAGGGGSWIDRGRDEFRRFFPAYEDGTVLANEVLKALHDYETATDEKSKAQAQKVIDSIDEMLSLILLVPDLSHEGYKKATSYWSEILRTEWGGRKVSEMITEGI